MNFRKIYKAEVYKNIHKTILLSKMIKQLKVYELEDSLEMPNINYDDWNNPVAKELTDKGFDFLTRILLSKNSLYRVTDLIDNKPEIIEAYKKTFKNKETKLFISSILRLYSISNQLIEFSEIDDAEDIIVISHSHKNNKSSLCLYILKKIMNTVLSDREVIEVIGKELTAFEYNKLASFVLSEDSLFSISDLENAKEEIKNALRYKFMSEKTMQFVSFLNKLNLNSKQTKKDMIFLMDILKIQV